MDGPVGGGVRRFRDTTSGVLEFAAEDIHVVCPRCAGHALVTAQTGPGGGVDGLHRPGALRPRRLVCRQCLHRARSGSVLHRVASGRDPFFDTELWLATPCCGRLLWAFNAGHLAFLEGYLGATLREHVRDRHRSSTVGERLPAWMTSRKNRAEVLRGLAHLREKSLGMP